MTEGNIPDLSRFSEVFTQTAYSSNAHIRIEYLRNILEGYGINPENWLTMIDDPVSSGFIVKILQISQFPPTSPFVQFAQLVVAEEVLAKKRERLRGKDVEERRENYSQFINLIRSARERAGETLFGTEHNNYASGLAELYKQILPGAQGKLTVRNREKFQKAHSTRLTTYLNTVRNRLSSVDK